MGEQFERATQALIVDERLFRKATGFDTVVALPDGP
jgi:hypothetical protein